MEADALAKAISVGGAIDDYEQVPYMPSIDLPEVQQIEGEGNWTTPIIVYLNDGKLPEDKDEARKLRIRAAKYVLIDKVMYKRGFSQPYLRCLAPDELNYVLREVHEGACENHLGARALVHKVVCASYYWPTIQADAKAYVKVCDQCQRFSNVPIQPSEYPTPMMAQWPFMQWGLDILGPFPLGTRFKANGQVEVANRSLLKIIETQLEGAKGVWPDELPGVLWVYRTTVRTPTRETPFKLAYGSKAVIPAEVHMANHRVMKY
ncbi:uncharacterized protein LOC142628387 [Castanea sativa]|uniref:uncharacterized protein LOC142628387 n=1 Tax=Castanea sativa TaxID=21020 RepID=UPI003F64CA56